MFGCSSVAASARLGQEHLHELRILGQVGEDPLEHDDLLESLQADPLGHIELGHAPAGELPDDVVVADAVAGARARSPRRIAQPPFIGHHRHHPAYRSHRRFVSHPSASG